MVLCKIIIKIITTYLIYSSLPYYSFLSAAREAAAVPRFLDRMVNQSVVEGAPVLFSAEAVGVPTPMMSWQKDGKMLSSDNHYQIQQDGPRSSLQIAAARPDDSAWFQCSAVNTAGSASNRARLIVQGLYSYNHLTLGVVGVVEGPTMVWATIGRSDEWREK